jgi:hypothetical protein
MPAMRRLVAVGTILVGLAWTAPAPAATWIVDAPNPEVECPNADSPSIEAAVTLAAPGDTILVCPGEYDETVTVTKPLRLNGAGPDPHIRVGDPTQEAVLDPVQGIGFVIEAPEAVLEGFTVSRASIGARVHAAASGFVIRKNLFIFNATALQLASDGARRSVVQENTFRDNRRFAIFNNAGTGALRNVEIKVNDFMRNATSILAIGQLADLLIDNNTFLGERLEGIFVGAGLRTAITHNRLENVTRPINVGVLRPGIVAWNSVIGSRPIGIEVFTGANASVSYNYVVQSGHGIRLQNFLRGEVRGNHVEANALNGLSFLNNSSSNFVEVNVARANGRDGIYVDDRSSINRIENNHSDGNVEHDCHDDTVGPGPGGTRNFWEHNLGDTANRPGICKPTGQAPGESVSNLARPLELAFAPESPCMPYAEARETPIESPRWDEAPWVCDPAPEDLEPLPEDA